MLSLIVYTHRFCYIVFDSVYSKVSLKGFAMLSLIVYTQRFRYVVFESVYSKVSLCCL